MGPPPATQEGPEHVSELDQLAAAPYRPSWAPIPVLRGQTVVIDQLGELLDGGTPAEQARSAFLMGQIGWPKSVPSLAKRLAVDERQVRVQAGIALACLGDRRGLHTCAAVLSSGSAWIKYYAAYGLWCLKGALPAEAQRIDRVLTANRLRQPPIVKLAIDGALQSPFVTPPAVDELEPESSAGSPVPQQIWEQAADALVRESDWWFHKGDYDQAIRCSQASILLDPAYVETYTVIAWLQWSLGRNTEAIGTLHRAIAANPQDPDAYFALGYQYFNTREYSKAEGYLDKSVSLAADHLAVRTYAHCLERLGKLDQCLKQWASLLRDRPTDGAVRLNYERVQKLIETKGK